MNFLFIIPALWRVKRGYEWAIELDKKWRDPFKKDTNSICFPRVFLHVDVAVLHQDVSLSCGQKQRAGFNSAKQFYFRPRRWALEANKWDKRLFSKRQRFIVRKKGNHRMQGPTLQDDVRLFAHALLDEWKRRIELKENTSRCRVELWKGNCSANYVGTDRRAMSILLQFIETMLNLLWYTWKGQI